MTLRDRDMLYAVVAVIESLLAILVIRMVPRFRAGETGQVFTLMAAGLIVSALVFMIGWS